MTILILANNDGGLYGFRRELIEALIEEGHTVVASVPDGLYIEKLRNLGCKLDICDRLERHGTNPLKELGLIHYYKKLLRCIRPDIVFTYTIKPNVYGGWLCGKMHIPYVVNITGLGTAVENSGLMQRVMLMLYRKGVKCARKVFFQNVANQDYMLAQRVISGAYDLLPGSGVNVEYFPYQSYDEHKGINFLTIGRLMRDKGTDEILEAARVIKKKYTDVTFTFIGYVDDEQYRQKIERACEEGLVRYDGEQEDVKTYLRSCDALIHASYHEGLSNVLLEAASSGRAVIATDVPGCAETYVPDVTGIAFHAGDTNSLIGAIEKFLQLSDEQRRKMGRLGRQHVIENFDRRRVVDKYLMEVMALKGK